MARYAPPPYALDDRLLNRWRGHRAGGAVAFELLLRAVADVVAVAALLVGRVRRVHAGAAAGAVDEPTQQSLEFDTMGVARRPRVLFRSEVAVAALLVGRVRRVHAGAAAGAVDEHTQQSLEFDTMGVARRPRVLFETLLGQVEGLLIDDCLVLARENLLADLHLPGVEDVAEQLVNVAPA